ncbi:hypothetical protein Pcinc_036917 [Petrolisthes cinctipes]|uniref:Uncharacterized protein n=1 Tax=Petrolisthes cinctipes TaxID=88211 RepID=A0AAE1BUN1_PETCI|nr:hypothetical protein Pcinc_036917 [Petrolisthes cinctipes]
MITECDGESYNTAATLLYCRRRILRPRDLIISILGYRPWSKDEMDQSSCCKFINTAHFLTILTCLCAAPVFQYNICLRRDEGIGKEVMNSMANSTLSWTERESCRGNFVFVYVVPGLLFVLSYMVTCIILRLGEIEHLQTLPERVFLLASCSPWELVKQRRLWCVFLGWLLIGVTCLTFTLASLILHVIAAPPLPYILIKPQNELEKTVLCVATLGLLWLQDIVMVMGILLYCSQCHLLSRLLNIIRTTIYQGASTLISIKRQIDETSRFLRHLNQELGLSVGLYLCLVTFRASTAAITLFSATSDYLHQVGDGEGPMSVVSLMFGGTHFSQSLHFIAMTTNLVPWLVLLLVPLLTAARVTSSYRALCKAGSQLHGRPFGYQSTPQLEIDSFLLYVSSLHLQAKIMWVPIRTYFLVSIIVLASVTFIILGYLYF